MKRILVSFFVGLLWCTSTLAETVMLDNEVKIKIPEKYEFLQLDYIKFFKLNVKGILKPDEIKKTLQEQKDFLAFDGTETTTIVAAKGFSGKAGYGSLIKHIYDGGSDQNWKGWSKIRSLCQSRSTTEQKFLKCALTQMKADPIIQIDVGKGTSEEIKEISSGVVEISEEEIKDFNENFETVKNKFGSRYKNEMDFSFEKISDSKWAFLISGKENMFGIKGERKGYMIPHRGHMVLVQGFCYSKKTCSKIDRINKEIIGPFLRGPEGKKIKKDKGNIAEKLEKLKILYDKGSLTKEEFERAKELVLN